jgi:hypothetical protein
MNGCVEVTIQPARQPLVELPCGCSDGRIHAGRFTIRVVNEAFRHDNSRWFLPSSETKE